MTDSTNRQNPASPEARGANWYSRLSLISSIAGIYIVGTAKTMQELRTTSVWGGVAGIAAVILGISGLRYFRILRKGRGLAITGIVIGTLVGIGIFRPLIDDAMQSASRDTAKRLIGHPVSPLRYIGQC